MAYNKESIWLKALTVEGFDQDKYRKDACGAWIMFEQYGQQHNFGWEIDHIYPQSRGGGDDVENLRPLHYLNNKSKSDDYPTYIAAVSANGNRNEEVNKTLTVNEEIQKILFNLYRKK